MTTPRLLAALTVLLALLWPTPRAQATTTCTATASNLAFGSVNGSANVDTSAGITVTCTTSGLSVAGTTSVRMCLSITDGANGSGQLAPRRMTDSFGDALQFQIYRDTARTQVWGSSSNGTTPQPLDLQYSTLISIGSFSGSASTTMYARVPTQTGLSAGDYSNPFTGTYTSLQYSYKEPGLVLSNPGYPATCTSGNTGSGTGGGTIAFPFTASATVPSSCAFNSASDLAFGSAASLATGNNDRTSSLVFTCTGRTAWNIGLDNGKNASGNTRRMRLGTSGNYVNYELYRDSNRSQRWGSTINTDTATGTGTGVQQTLTIYGRVPSPQTPVAGSYSDTVTATVTY